MKLTKNIGKTLQEARLRKNMPLEQIEFETKISVSILHKIEENSFDGILPEVYIKGYIRNFGKVVGVNEDLLMALYKRDYEFADYRREKVRSDTKTDFRKFIDLFSFVKPKQILSVLAIIFIAITSYALFNFISNAFEKPYLKLNEPFEITADYSGKYSSPENTIILRGETESGVNVYLGDVPLVLNSSFQFSTNPLALEGELETFTIKAENSLGRTSTIVLAVDRRERSIDNLNFSILVNESTNESVDILLDGKLSISEKLLAGDNIALSADNYFEIKTVEPSKLEVTIFDETYKLDSSETRFRVDATRTEIIKE